MQVKKYLRTALLLLAAGLIVVGTVKRRPAYRQPEPRPITIQRLAEHRITIGGGVCTATAVAPHAILTAAHCNEKDSATTLRIDMAVRDFKILSKTTDGRDHVIYILDGPAFSFIVLLQPGVHAATPFEHVYIYGCGDGIYPPLYKHGSKTGAVQDLSDVDQEEGLSFYTIPVIPGDSGSAVYGEDGRIIAVTTYKLSIPIDGNWDTDDDADIQRLDAAFDVNFTAKQLTAIAANHGDTPLGSKKFSLPSPTLVK